jgi:ABC-type Mn2+/Zn2+ transport system ATPase subunit
VEIGYAIEISDLRKSYGDHEVLQGVNLKVERGAMLALLGPNGAGKSTVVRILSTLTGLTGGTALVNGFDVVKQADGVRSSIGLVSQFMALGAACRRTAGTVRPGGGGRTAGQELFGRHAPEAGSGNQSDHGSTGPLSGRADDRSRPA